MAIDQDRKYRDMALRGKYQRLYTRPCGLRTQEWRTSFREIESIVGFELPRVRASSPAVVGKPERWQRP